jgi:hypothetical protein
MAEIDELRAENAELRRLLADARRQIEEGREAIDALMRPAPSELLAQNYAHPSRR